MMESFNFPFCRYTQISGGGIRVKVKEDFGEKLEEGEEGECVEVSERGGGGRIRDGRGIKVRSPVH